MLETFGWTDGVVLRAEGYTVAAAIDMSWNQLRHFTGPGAVFGFVLDGENATLRRLGGPCSLPSGSYFVVPAGGAELASPGGRVLLVHQDGADFPPMVGGPIEARGRLRYIDGCTDSLLIPPWRRGAACLNLLHIPPGVEQTMHTHPSDRIGVVVSGRGQCVTPAGNVDLEPGLLWRIPADGLHRFRTDDEAVLIVAWHPDSDFGPTDDEHPMLLRTLVDGVRASELSDIRTK